MCSREKAQEWPDQKNDKNLTKFDPCIETEERRKEPVGGQVDFHENAGKAKSMRQAEGEGDQSS